MTNGRSVPKAGTTPEQLYGTWRLVEFVSLVDGEVRGHVLGVAPLGQLNYDADGSVAALLMARERPWPPALSFLEADDGARGRAALDFVAYGGRFELSGNTVVHHVELSLYPELVGTDLVRVVSWSDGQLVLETERQPTRSGRLRWQRLTWTRARRQTPGS